MSKYCGRSPEILLHALRNAQDNPHSRVLWSKMLTVGCAEERVLESSGLSSGLVFGETSKGDFEKRRE